MKPKKLLGAFLLLLPFLIVLSVCVYAKGILGLAVFVGCLLTTAGIVACSCYGLYLLEGKN